MSVSVPKLSPDFALHVLPHSGAERLTRLAARACDAPMAIIVTLEGGEAVFHAGTGFSAQEREGLAALCEATLETPSRQPPLPARCAPEIGFYRGLPLSREDGTRLGVLAVMDKAARSLSPAQEEDLETLAGLAAAQLDALHGRAMQATQQTEEDAQRLATRLGITLESITEGFYTLDPQWRFSYLNREGARLLGRPTTELLGKSIWKEFPGAINTLFSEQVRAAVAGNYQVEFEALYAPLDKWFEIRAYPFPDGLAIYFRDVSERRQAREQLMLLETSISRLNDIVLIAEAVPSGKPGLRIIFANNAFEQHTGYSPGEALGHSPRLLCGPLTQRSELERLRNAFQKGEPVQAELITYKKNGRHFWMEVDIVPVADDAGVFVTHWVAVGRDITRRKVTESEIKHLAFYDPLTQLPNRQLLMERLEKALSHNRRHPREGALMFIDLDNFKTLNDTMGHQKGDLLLQQVARRLAACVRQTDTVARLGGDEFVVMLEDLGQDPAEATVKAEIVSGQILAALSEPYSLAGYQHYSTCSIGVTAFNQTLNNIGDLLKQADLAMYQAKMAGRNTVCFFNPAMQAAVTASAALQSDLRRGLREKQFLLYYQPQVGRDGRMTGVEALLRWQHGERGLVQPAEFIPAAEEAGLILPLGQWALETACRQLASWAQRPETAALSIAVNVSVRQFRHPEFVDLVMAALKETRVSPHKLKLELTESLLAEDMEITITKMARLKKMGVTLSLDDFGMGYSSLSCLKRLPLDQLKIDKSFVEDILRDPNDAAIARTIIGLAQSLGLGVVAEGVETEAQRDFLSRHGCDCYQGYLFCKPLPIGELEAFIKTLRM
ncbi:EAL domain-containing protein [Polaromonas sp. YR568]|uniref:sensor domain-containing protein n=1 Tax=Polaromonas sp. YR568 TaxID=1855301 RepID=UPI00398C148D